MLKSKVFCLIFVAVLMMSACGRQANTPRERETASPLTETVQESSGNATEPVPEKSLDRAGNCFHVLSHEPGRQIRIHRLRPGVG